MESGGGQGHSLHQLELDHAPSAWPDVEAQKREERKDQQAQFYKSLSPSLVARY